MRVFVTGASGFIGSAVVQELMAAGHDVLGLARSDASAEALEQAGAKAHRGSMADLGSLEGGARKAEGGIHLAFNPDFSKFKENCETDRLAIEAIGEALSGTDRPLVVTSGLALLAEGRVATEDDPPVPVSSTYPRASEVTALALVPKGIHVSIVRLPQVHDRDRQGLVTYLIALAQEKGLSAYVGEGRNRWAAIHRLDAAALYRLVLEHGAAGGRYHAIAEEGVSLKDIATAIGRRLGVPGAAARDGRCGAAPGHAAGAPRGAPRQPGVPRRLLCERIAVRLRLTPKDRGLFLAAGARGSGAIRSRRGERYQRSAAEHRRESRPAPRCRA